jgi:dephospho-CoA kinase
VRRRTLLVGLTGGLACGKSTVLAVFAELGAATTDADLLARQAFEDEAVLGRARRLLGADAFGADGRLDRARAASVVFADPERRRRLEAIVHPEVIRLEEEEVARFTERGEEVVVCDVPLLFEAGRAPRFDRLVVVSCPEEVQVARAVGRGMSEADARRRVAAQMPVGEKAARADYVIDTSGSLEETRAAARRVYQLLRADAGALRRGEPLPERR